MTGEQLHARLVGRAAHEQRVVECQRHRLLDQDVLAGPDRSQGLLAVHLGRCGDVEDVDLAHLEDGVEVLEGLAAEVADEGLAGLLTGIGHRDHAIRQLVDLRVLVEHPVDRLPQPHERQVEDALSHAFPASSPRRMRHHAAALQAQKKLLNARGRVRWIRYTVRDRSST
ncbi:MAG: hypothetical protein M3Q22_00490 [Actinomycetota bacterium]|nr:hypothetical protein [Actinomycetota bacterium]